MPGLTELVNPPDEYNAIDIAVLRDVSYRPACDAGQTVERDMEDV